MKALLCAAQIVGCPLLCGESVQAIEKLVNAVCRSNPDQTSISHKQKYCGTKTYHLGSALPLVSIRMVWQAACSAVWLNCTVPCCQYRQRFESFLSHALDAHNTQMVRDRQGWKMCSRTFASGGKQDVRQRPAPVSCSCGDTCHRVRCTAVLRTQEGRLCSKVLTWD